MTRDDLAGSLDYQKGDKEKNLSENLRSRRKQNIQKKKRKRKPKIEKYK